MESTQTSYIDPADAFFVVFVAIFTSLVSEGNYYIINYNLYRNFMAIDLQTQRIQESCRKHFKFVKEN